MDPNELLPITRTEFQKTFVQSLEQALPQSVEVLFRKAESSYTSVEQGRYLHACTLLRRPDELIQQMSINMDALLTRSFQTTYNTFRPVSALSMKSSSLSLVDANAFDDELLLNEITESFRIEAGDQIRDLNIRIAILFAQDNIKERENPFRPYLLARCIANTIDALNLERELCNILETQIAENFSRHVLRIYENVNHCLALNGVAAELQFKLKKTNLATPAQSSNNVMEDDLDTATDDIAQSGEASNQFPGVGQQNQSRVQQYPGGAPSTQSGIVEIGGKFYNTASREISSDQPRSPVERLFETVRGIAAGISGAMAQPHVAGVGQVSGNGFAKAFSNGYETGFNSGNSQRYPNAAEQNFDQQTAQSAGSPFGANQFKWLAQNQTIGSVLRKVFGGQGNTTATNGNGNATQMHLYNDEGSDAGAETTSGSTSEQAAKYQSGGNDSTGSDMQSNNTHPGGASSDASNSSQFKEMPRYSESGIVQSVHQLQKTHTAPIEQMFDQLGRIRNLILEQRAQLNDMTEDVDEQMTIDVVAMLFEFILSDNQVPAEIRAQLGRLQFLVLKIALRDQSLLTQKGHPARLLINRVGSISLGLKQIDPSGVHITQEICRIVETLLEDESENSQLFTRMLDEFDAFIARELRNSDKQLDQTVVAVEEAQNRTLRLVHITAQLQEVLKKLTINSFLRDFLESTWISAIEVTERDDIRRGTRYRLLVPDLLWSIVPKAVEDDRTQLFALLPIILGTIREGLASINCDPKYQKELLDWLVDAHTAALRTTQSNVQMRSLSLPSVHEHFHHFVYPDEETRQDLLGEARTPEIQKILDKAIRDLDIKVEMLDQICSEELATESAPITTDNGGLSDAATPIATATPEMIKERLRTGVSLELHLGFKPSVGKLSWVDPQLQNLVLRLDGHDKPSLVSVRMFRRMIAHGRVKFMEAEPLFERAVQALLTSADVVDQPIAA
ncbi:DUF1631 family protein [Undibacterium sp. Dicai25W]|uniref:DUF1631 family protein n=1 Tax=Undibacterium sp. Dicai25W TaxID=3413034 RepID=UPI003BF14BDD